MLAATYVVPLRWHDDGPLEDFTAYLGDLARWVDQIVVVDGSAADRFQEHHRRWAPLATHVTPHPDLRFLNGKVDGVLTGIRLARHERIVLADDDVRYDPPVLRRVVDELDSAEVVRPQNYFAPLPWHARWDTARTLLGRCLGGDFPGTLAVRRSTLVRTGGYDGDVLFENLELMRTVEAAGGSVAHRPDLYVRRLPPTTRHFLSQRVRQAYDEFARPVRLAASLLVLPVVGALVASRRYRAVAAAAATSVAVAEVGRRRAGGQAMFPATCSLWAPAWVAERAVCCWLAVGQRLFRGGCSYAGRRIPRAATPPRQLRRRMGAVGATDLLGPPPGPEPIPLPVPLGFGAAGGAAGAAAVRS